MGRGDARDLYDADRGTLSPRAFVDEDVWHLELERIFGRCWLFLCPEAQIPNPGDFFQTYMGTDRVLVTRNRHGRVSVLLNQCRHRGNELCRADSGNQKVFTCSYHGWTYDLDGRLVNVPAEKESYFGDLDKAAWGAATPARVDTYKGLIFATWDPDAPGLIDYLGDAAWHLDMFVDRFDDGLELVGGVNKWIMECNWKMPAEQFASDLYHTGQTHLSTFAGLTMADLEPLDTSANRQFATEEGHGGVSWYRHTPILEMAVGAPGAKFFNDTLDQAAARLGPERTALSPTALTLFPNVSFMAGLGAIRVYHPVSATTCEQWSWVLVPAGAPEEVKRSMFVNHQRTFGPGGTFEPDDVANWKGIQRSLRGYAARRFPLNVQMGLRRARRADPGYPSGVSPDGFSEAAARGFYRRWADLLSSAGWPEITAPRIVGSSV